jgi:hypothetical protein
MFEVNAQLDLLGRAPFSSSVLGRRQCTIGHRHTTMNGDGHAINAANPSRCRPADR